MRGRTPGSDPSAIKPGMVSEHKKISQLKVVQGGRFRTNPT